MCESELLNIIANNPYLSIALFLATFSAFLVFSVLLWIFLMWKCTQKSTNEKKVCKKVDKNEEEVLESLICPSTSFATVRGLSKTQKVENTVEGKRCLAKNVPFALKPTLSYGQRKNHKRQSSSSNFKDILQLESEAKNVLNSENVEKDSLLNEEKKENKMTMQPEPHVKTHKRSPIFYTTFKQCEEVNHSKSDNDVDPVVLYPLPPDPHQTKGTSQPVSEAVKAMSEDGKDICSDIIEIAIEELRRRTLESSRDLKRVPYDSEGLKLPTIVENEGAECCESDLKSGAKLEV